jgi:glycine/D-amino acid oxidase-like deaminating enzyme
MLVNMPNENTSPWLKQVRKTRRSIALSEDSDSDVAIVGGGISGVVTSYFILCDTDLKVLLMEKGRAAHGATGHNGGQAVAAFERSLIELCEKFGENLVREGLLALHDSWKLLYSIIEETGIDVHLQEITAHIALTSFNDIILVLKEKHLMDRLGLSTEDILLAEDVAKDIPQEYQPLFKRVKRKELRDILLTRDGKYICAWESRVGLINSAIFCEELISWMLNRFSGRFRIYEDTKVQRIKVGNGKDKNMILETSKNVVNAKHAVLCTNGYNDLMIDGIDTSIKIRGLVGFMIGYTDKKERDPIASVYFSKRRSGQESYFYLTQRRYIEGSKRALTSIGGPDLHLRDKEKYSSEKIPDIERYYFIIEEFYRNTIIDASEYTHPDFSWNGLMGYTSDGVRLIGPDPTNPYLIYNTGCNGIGILPSIYGGKRVAQVIKGETFPPSIFDPILQLRNLQSKNKAAYPTTYR